MKILVLSLLRIGDIVLSTPVLKGLREKHPDAEIHLLINSQFKQISPLVPYVDRTLLFDRENLQKGLGDASVPVFESYERLEAQIDRLNAERYDAVINLTHNRLSGWIMSLIESKEKIGLCFDAQGRATFGSSWFRYLNTQVDAEGKEAFHFTDVFRFGLGLDNESLAMRASLVETPRGRAEAEEFLASIGVDQKRLVSVQALTSDTKKDWGIERFAAALAQIQAAHPSSVFAILGAPFERDRLQPLMDLLAVKGVRAHLAILSFEGAYSLLRCSRLLLTGDTSIKHLACAARTPVVEISLGSSDVYRTGAYLHGSIIVQSREACAPCPHSKACHRPSHVCAEKIPADVVAMVTGEVFAGRSFQLQAIAEEYNDEVEILRVELRDTGFWAAHSIIEPFAAETVGRWIDLACRKLWLERAPGNRSGAYRMGTETRRLANLLKTIHPAISEIEWRHLLSELERQAEFVESRINGFKVGLQYLRGHYEDPRRMTEYVRGLIALRERIRHLPLLSSFKMALDQVIEDDISPAFTRFRRIQDLVIEIETRSEIYLRLIRGLEGSEDMTRGAEKR